MISIILNEEGTNEQVLEVFQEVNEELLNDLPNYFDNYKIQHIEIYGMTNGINFHTIDCKYLDEYSTEVEDIYNLLEELFYMDDEDKMKVEAIAEYEGISVFQVNIDTFLNAHIMFDSIEDYYHDCDEILEECYRDFFDSSLSFYFDYDFYHRDCDIDCYECENGIVIKH